MDTSSRREDRARIERFIAMIGAPAGLTLRHVSAGTGLSRARIQRAMAEVEPATSFRTVAMRHRMQRAAIMLRDRGNDALTTTKIARVLGYANRTQFSRAFHAFYGQAQRVTTRPLEPSHRRKSTC